MNRCLNERRKVARRASDRTVSWKMTVTMGVLFIGWAGVVYLHSLVSKVL